MKFKVSNTEMLALITLLFELIEKTGKYINQAYENHSKDSWAEEKLSLSIFEDMLINLQQKALIKKERYSLKLKPWQAINFWLQFNGIMNETTQEGNLVQTICNSIHQQILIK